MIDLFSEFSEEDFLALEIFYDDVFANLPDPTEGDF